MQNVSPLIPTQTRAGHSVIASANEVALAINNSKTITPASAAAAYLGYYQPTQAYAAGKVVFSVDSFYLSLLPSTGVVPAGNPTHWQRLSYTSEDIASYLRNERLSPTTCPATGPSAAPSTLSPYTLWVSTLGEYWEWFGNSWGVAWKHWTNLVTQSSGTVPAGNILTTQHTWTVPRAGVVDVMAHTRWQINSVSHAGVVTSIGIYRNGGQIAASPFENTNETGPYPVSNSVCSIGTTVQAGDTVFIYYRCENSTAVINSGRFTLSYKV